MSYGLFNWWWGEDEVVFDDKWDTLFILNLEETDLGSYAYLWNTLSTFQPPRNSSVIYDSRICSIVHHESVTNADEDEVVRNHYGQTSWDWLLDNHPHVASLLRNEPCLIHTNLDYNKDAFEILRITATEFNKLFIWWETEGWWVLKSPELNRKVGRILKKRSTEKYDIFADLSGGKIQ